MLTKLFMCAQKVAIITMMWVLSLLRPWQICQAATDSREEILGNPAKVTKLRRHWFPLWAR